MQVGRVKHVDVQLESVTWALRSPFLERVKSPILRLKVTFAQLNAIFSLRKGGFWRVQNGD